MNPIEQLKAFVDSISPKKPLSSEESATARDFAADAILAPECDLNNVLEVMDHLPPTTIAQAIRRAWEGVEEKNKSALLRWVAVTRDGDKTIRRVALTAAELLPIARDAALSLFDSIVPAYDQDATLDLKHALKSAFLGKRGGQLETIAEGEDPKDVVLRICRILLKFMSKSEAKFDFGPRLSLARTTARLLVGRDPRRNSFAMTTVMLLRNELQAWREDPRDQFTSTLTAAECAVVFWDSVDTAVQASPVAPLAHSPANAAPIPPIPEQQQSSLEPELFVANEALSASRPDDNDLCSLADGIEERLQSALRELEWLRAAKSILAELRRARSLPAKVDELERQLTEARENARSAASQHEREIASLHHEISTASADVDRLNCENRRLSEELATSHISERQLIEQIRATADVEVEQFKKNLGTYLSPLISDLPDKDIAVSAEGAQMLLRQYHKFVDKIEERGVPLRSRGVRA